MVLKERADRLVDSEKITINLGFVDLGHIDLLVREGFIPIAPTSSERRFATNSTVTRTP